MIRTPTHIPHQRRGQPDAPPRNSAAVRALASSRSLAAGSRCACGGGCPRCRAKVQAKLKVGAPHDQYEEQADRIASDVMTMTSQTPLSIRPYSSGHQRAIDGRPFLESGLAATHASGRPLPQAVRAFMEPRFMTDFSAVRVHTDSDAVEMNRDLRARAFAHGADIYYGDGHVPGNDALTAHELAHVVQQSPASRSAVVQTSPDEASAETTEQEDTSFVDEAAKIIEDGGGKAKFHYASAELDTDAIFVLFDDFAVHRLFRYLLGRWFGSSDFDPSLEVGSGAAPPPWVGEFRAKALNPRKPPKPNPYTPKAYMEELANPNYEEDKKLGDLGRKLADSVSAETPGQKVRRQMVEEIDKRIGTTVMSQTAIDAEREKPASSGLTPQNFTTCIEFFSQVTRAVMNQSGSSKPLLSGPNAYIEINPLADPPLSLPPGAWHACSGKARPKPGDLLIFTFSTNEYDKGTLTHGKGDFAHISILRSIEPVSESSSKKDTEKPREKFVSVDGGGTTALEVVRYFSPDTCQIQGPGTLVRTLKGWIDVEKAAEAALLKKP